MSTWAKLSLSLILAGCGSSEFFPLTDATSLTPVNEVITPVTYKDRSAVKVELTPQLQADLNAQISGMIPTPAVATPFMAKLPVDFQDGTIEVDLAGEVNGKGPTAVRGFVGLVFRVSEDSNRYETFFLRMTNGLLAVPPPPVPRDTQGIQYESHPDWSFQRLRDMYPGTYETSAAVAPAAWFHVRIAVAGQTAQVFIGESETPTITVEDLKLGKDARGAVGLFSGNGTAAYFSNLSIHH